jgi:hypothetical protein
MKIHRAMYDWGGRKYLELETDTHKVLRVKIPWRYGRVMCKIDGIKTVQEFQKGDRVQVTISTKIWDGIEYSVLESIKEWEPSAETAI